ncbi:MAG: polysaccharide biosynthesis/export family protein [Verrucomicrobiota bacterium]
MKLTPRPFGGFSLHRGFPVWAALVFAAVSGLFAQSPESLQVRPALSASDPMAGSHHKISSDDLLEILVFQEADLSTRARVSREGTILMPLIGKVSVKGRTVADAANIITSKLRDGYLVNPQVTVNVVSLAKRYFTVLGQVATPGQFELTTDRPTDLLAAIGRAGGFTRIANKRKVILKRRTTSGSYAIRTFNANDLSRETSASPILIKDGDIIEVLEGLF